MNEGARVIDIFSYETGYHECLERQERIERERYERKLERSRHRRGLRRQFILGLLLVIGTVVLLYTGLGRGEDASYALLTLPVGLYMMLTKHDYYKETEDMYDVH